MIVAIIVLSCLSITSSFIQRGFFPVNPLVNSRTSLRETTADFKNGMTFEIEGVPHKLVEFLHVKPGKGAAFVRSKVKNLVTGGVNEKTFRAGESVTMAEIVKTEMQYTFTDGTMIVFMNMETFEEVRIDKSKFESNQIQLLKEGLSCRVAEWNGNVLEVELPITVEYVVKDTAPNFKGNTAQGATKPATLDCGAVVNVPMFIEVGEKVIVSTADCKYVNRA